MRRAVGLLHPGAMGHRIGSALVQAGNEVWWCGEGRSAASASRAEKIGLKDAGSLPNLVEKCKVIVCICPPVSALPVAQSVFASGFQGMYCDANALVPDDALKVGVSSMHLFSFAEFTSFIESMSRQPQPLSADTIIIYAIVDRRCGHSARVFIRRRLRHLFLRLAAVRYPR